MARTRVSSKHDDTLYPDEECAVCVAAIERGAFGPSAAIGVFPNIVQHKRRNWPKFAANFRPVAYSPDLILHTIQREFYPSIVEHYRQFADGELVVEYEMDQEGRVWIVDGHHRLLASLLNKQPVVLLAAV